MKQFRAGSKNLANPFAKTWPPGVVFHAFSWAEGPGRQFRDCCNDSRVGSAALLQAVTKLESGIGWCNKTRQLAMKLAAKWRLESSQSGKIPKLLLQIIALTKSATYSFQAFTVEVRLLAITMIVTPFSDSVHRLRLF
jgi:hypothetical protein